MADATRTDSSTTGPAASSAGPPDPVTGAGAAPVPVRAAAARPGWTLVLASLGSFLAALDVVVVATALPVMRVDLGASPSGLEWTVNAYNLVFACLMMTGAALGDRFGRRRSYVAGLLVFAAASAAAALSTSVGPLIAARVVQGAGAAVLLPLTLTLISDAFPAEKRGAAIGVWGGVSGLGIAAGPVVGGAITQGATWQWIFWLYVPVAVAVALLARLLLTESRGPRPQLDIVGLLLVGAGMFALTWAPVRAPEAGWGSAEVVGALAAGAVLIGAFAGWERRTWFPMLPPSYFRSRGFSTANAVIFFQAISLIGTLFFMTQLFQVAMGYRPFEAGLRLLVWMAVPMVVAPIAGILADRIGNKPFMVGGLALQSAGLAWLGAVVRPDVGYGSLIGPLLLSGVGISMCFPTTANAVTAAVPPQDAGVAAGANTALRELGGVFGVAIMSAVFAAHGGYASPAAFVDGFRPAIRVAAFVPVLGLVAALLAPGGRPEPLPAEG